MNESSAHLFFQCSFTVEVWNDIRVWLGMIKFMASSSSLLRAFRSVCRGSSNLAKLRLNAHAATVYTLWNARIESYLMENKPLLMTSEE